MVTVLLFVLLLAALAVIAAEDTKRREWRRAWAADERWIRSHWTGAGSGDYEAARAADIRTVAPGHTVRGSR